LITFSSTKEGNSSLKVLLSAILFDFMLLLLFEEFKFEPFSSKPSKFSEAMLNFGLFAYCV